MTRFCGSGLIEVMGARIRVKGGKIAAQQTLKPEAQKRQDKKQMLDHNSTIRTLYGFWRP